MGGDERGGVNETHVGDKLDREIFGRFGSWKMKYRLNFQRRRNSVNNLLFSCKKYGLPRRKIWRNGSAGWGGGEMENGLRPTCLLIIPRGQLFRMAHYSGVMLEKRRKEKKVSEQKRKDKAWRTCLARCRAAAKAEL